MICAEVTLYLFAISLIEYDIIAPFINIIKVKVNFKSSIDILLNKTIKYMSFNL